MELRDTIIGRSSGKPFEAYYRDIDSEKDFEGIKIQAARAYCFYKDKLVVVHELKGHWGLPGGQIEDGENVRDGLRREIKEETNMNVLRMRFIGFQEAKDSEKTTYYVRAVCLVEPYGEFVKDPANEVTEIKLIDPAECCDLADANWGRIGERMLERALEQKKLIQMELDAIK